MNWLHSVLLGFVSGLCELLPLSSQASRGLLRQILGAPAEGTIFTLLCRAAVLAVLLASGLLELRKLRRTAKILRMPYRRRTGTPSLNESGTIRLLRVAALPALAGGMLSVRLSNVSDMLWLVTIPLVLGGLLMWLPTHMHSANKDGRHLTGVDALVISLGALAAAVPGISLLGVVYALACMRGAHRRYALRFACMLLAVHLSGGILVDLLALFLSGFHVTGSQLLSAALGAAAAGLGSYLGIQSLHSLLGPGGAGLFGFCYYNWGQALLSMVLFLLV